MNRRRTQASCQINKRIHLTRKQFAVFKRTFRAFVKNALTDQNYPLFLRDLYAETYRRPGLFRVQIQFDQVRPRRQQTRSDYKKHTPPVLPDGRIARTPVPRPSEGDPATFYSLSSLFRYLLVSIGRSPRNLPFSTDHSSPHSVAPVQQWSKRSPDPEPTSLFEPPAD